MRAFLSAALAAALASSAAAGYVKAGGVGEAVFGEAAFGEAAATYGGGGAAAAAKKANKTAKFDFIEAKAAALKAELAGVKPSKKCKIDRLINGVGEAVAGEAMIVGEACSGGVGEAI